MSVDMLDLFVNINVTPIIIPGSLEFDDGVIGGGLPDFFQAWISAGPSMIVTPLLIIHFLFLFYSIPWLQMIFSQMVFYTSRVSMFPEFNIHLCLILYHHVDNFPQLVVAWETLHIMV